MLSTEKSINIDNSISRLEIAREALQLDMAAFCRLTGLRYASYHASVQRKSSLSEDVLKAIAIHTNVSIFWILTGRGDMLRGPHDDTGEDVNWREAAERYKLEAAEQRGRADAQEGMVHALIEKRGLHIAERPSAKEAKQGTKQ